ncbi:hypothetical protein A0257_22355 (plasmid) [Hymenobacter psoromatis]|nr:hypothetical protein A0257_22355 [Hymenobacter psoromatis]
MSLPPGLPTVEECLAAALGHLVAAAYAAETGRTDARNPGAAPWGPSPIRVSPDFPYPPDTTVAQAIRAALRADSRLAALRPFVQVHAGVATLLGTLSNLRARQVAEQIARVVTGVRQVHNLLKVRSDEPDAAIQAQVRAALRHDPYVSHNYFAVQVANGRVQLAGVVADYFGRERAADVAAGICGVVEVLNHVRLAVVPGAQAAPATSEQVLTMQGPLSREDLDAQLHQHYPWSALLPTPKLVG